MDVENFIHMGSLDSFSRNIPVSWFVTDLFECISHAKASKAVVTNFSIVHRFPGRTCLKLVVRRKRNKRRKKEEKKGEVGGVQNARGQVTVLPLQKKGGTKGFEVVLTLEF